MQDFLSDVFGHFCPTEGALFEFAQDKLLNIGLIIIRGDLKVISVLVAISKVLVLSTCNVYLYRVARIFCKQVQGIHQDASRVSVTLVKAINDDIMHSVLPS